MIAISAAAPSVPSAPPPATLPSKSGSDQPGAFLRFFGKQPDVATPPPQKKKADDSNNTGVIASVPVTLQALLPITLPQVMEQASGGEAADAATQKVEKLDAPRAEESPRNSGELAFAAKLVDTARPEPQLQQQAVTSPSSKPATPATAPANAAPLPQTAAESNAVRPVASTPATADRRAATPEHSPETPRQRSDTTTAAEKATPQARLQTETQSVQAPTATTSQTVVRDMNSSPVMSRTIDPAPAAQASDNAAPIRGASEQMQTPARLQDISIRVAGPQQNSASIRLIDNAGELRVAVRSTDPQLADSLRANVDQLTSRLNNSGIGAEIWRPSAVPAASRSESPSQNMSQDRQNSAAQQWRGSTKDQQNQNQNQQRPDWAEEFELWQ